MNRDGGAGALAPRSASAPDQVALWSFGITVSNGSGTTLSVQTAYLTAGSWATGEAPVVGSPINSGQIAQYANVAVQAFNGLGGTITLTPMTGGTVIISWSWPQTFPPSGSAVSQNTRGIAVTSRLTGVGSSSPVLQVSVSNIS